MTDMTRKPKVIVLMPAYRAGQRVIETFNKIPKGIVDEIIVVDDHSPDDTLALARTLPTRVYGNETNLGYGGNMKHMLAMGLESGGDIFIELHADGQYDPAAIPEALSALRPTDGMLWGSRLMTAKSAITHGMPPLKYWVNKFLTGVANVVVGTRLTEFQSGFRVYTRAYLERVPFQADSNDHLFSFETILQALYAGFTVTEIPVICTYEDGVTQMNLKKGIKYTADMMGALARYRLATMGKPDPVFSRIRTL